HARMMGEVKKYKIDRWKSASPKLAAPTHQIMDLGAHMCSQTRRGAAEFASTLHLERQPYFREMASPLRSALAISPTCLPESSRTAPFWFVRIIARAPLPTANPAPAAP